MPSSSASDLLGADFVRELEVLRRRLEIRARSGNSGEHLAKRRGGSSEFQEHRPYAPGANDPVSGCPDDRVTKHAMHRSPWSHVAWSGA